MTKTWRKHPPQPILESQASALKTMYYNQVRKDTETIKQPLKISLFIFTLLEAVRVIVSEAALLEGAIRWDEIFCRLAFSVLVSLFILGMYLVKKDSTPFIQKIEKIGMFVALATYCGIISIVLVRRVATLTENLGDDRDSFDFIALGLLMIPNILLSDIIFNRWFDKCIIPVWQMVTLAIVLITHSPLNLSALLLKIFTYCFYIVLIFWLKDKLRWKVFLQRMDLEEWTQIHQKILQNVPDNVAVYDFKGEDLFKNEFLKKFEETIEGKDILKAVVNIRKRSNFNSTQSLLDTEKFTTHTGREETAQLGNFSANGVFSENSFQNLPELFQAIQRLQPGVLISNKDIFIFDGKCLLASANEFLSVEIRLSIFEDLQDKNKRFLVILRDTTQRDIMATLESNNKFKDNILSSISHELRTPLNGFATLVDSCMNDQKVSSQVKETYIIPASRSATLLANIINYILDYSLLTKDKLKMRFRKVDIRKLLHDNYELIKNHYYKQNITFQFEIDERVPQYIQTDAERLTQVILNLLSNSFKFTKKGSVLFRTEMQGSYVRIVVRDTGIGMDEDAMNKLSNIFAESMAGEKVDPTSTGVGLGLTISQAISTMLGPERMSGLYFESILGYGTIFTFLVEDKDTESSLAVKANPRKISRLNLMSKRLVSTNDQIEETEKIENNYLLERLFTTRTPLYGRSLSFDEGDDQAHGKRLPYYQKEIEYLPSHESRRHLNEVRLEIPSLGAQNEIDDDCDYNEILVVDDEPINILAFEMTMKQLQKSVDKAYGGEEALELIEKKKMESPVSCPRTYKIIFMDVNMPLVDGYETTRRIKEKVKNKEIQDVVIVACTAYTEQEYRQSCLDAGMSDFVNKPITRAKIFEILEKYKCL